jgi:UDP-N-acetylglucosamine 2-epimerase
VKLNIPVAHVEAGLRSFNRIMPEEINRIVTDRVSDLLFAPTQTAIYNLQQEGLGPVTRFTGDVMYDSLLFYRNIVTADPDKYRIPNLPGTYLLSTIHRAENTDNPSRLQDILTAIGRLDLPVVLPIHPRTKKIISHFEIPVNLIMIDPVGYLRMVMLSMNALKILTDSGGLQKEAYFLGVPCITMRTETEWIETVHDGWNLITATDPGKIVEAVYKPFPSANRSQAFGNGDAAEIIVKLLANQ